MFKYAACFWILSLTLCAEVSAQRPQRTSPRVPFSRGRSTLSPYINMFGNNTGGTNQYLSFVRPQLQLQQFNQQQQQQFGQITQTLAMQQQYLLNNVGPNAPNAADPTGPVGSLQLRPSSARNLTPTRHGSYFNYSHYYNYPIQPTGVPGR